MQGLVGRGWMQMKIMLFKEMYFHFCIYSDKCTNTLNHLGFHILLIDIHCYDLGQKGRLRRCLFKLLTTWGLWGH